MNQFLVSQEKTFFIFPYSPLFNCNNGNFMSNTITFQFLGHITLFCRLCQISNPKKLRCHSPWCIHFSVFESVYQNDDLGNLCLHFHSWFSIKKKTKKNLFHFVKIWTLHVLDHGTYVSKFA